LLPEEAHRRLKAGLQVFVVCFADLFGPAILHNRKHHQYRGERYSKDY
jgi:hypothetical protein